MTWPGRADLMVRTSWVVNRGAGTLVYLSIADAAPTSPLPASQAPRTSGLPDYASLLPRRPTGYLAAKPGNTSPTIARVLSHVRDTDAAAQGSPIIYQVR
jgi:hypothetical protein